MSLHRFIPQSLRLCLIILLTLLSATQLAQAQKTIHIPADQPTIQAGINAASNGDTVLVAPGTYYENINFNGKAIIVTSSGGAAQTIIDGGKKAYVSVVTFASNEPRASVLSNFTIQHGGNGGVWVGPASASILNNIIVNNACINATISGASLFQGNTVGTVDNSVYNIYCTFAGTGLYVGGIESNDPKVQLDIIGNIIENNGGVVNFGGNGNVFIGNIIRNNVGEEGGIWISNTTNLIFVDNLVYGNKAANVSQYPQGAGGMTILVPAETADLHYGIIANNTFANNTASAVEYAATQLFLDGDLSGFIVSNNIFYGSGTLPALTCDGLYSYLSGPANFSHNDAFNPSGQAYDSSCGIQATSNENVSQDPLFVNAGVGNFQLTSSSPLIDAGDNSVISMLNQYAVSLPTDIAGDPRLLNVTGAICAVIDIGAYEYPGAPNTCTVTETLQSSPNPSLSGQSITFTAQLTDQAAVPTGDVQFLDGSNVLATQAVSTTGSAAFTTSALAVGTHTITANYQPSGIFNATTASLSQVVNGYPTATALSCAPSPAYPDQSIAFAIAVAMAGSGATGTPSGTVTLTDGGSPLTTLTLAGGAASYSAMLPIGTHTIVANYVPAAGYAASSATCTEKVVGYATSTSLTASPGSTTYGQPVSLSAATTITGSANVPTGAITFLDGATVLGSTALDPSGHATYVTSSLSPGTHLLTAVYSGTPLLAASTSPPTSETVLPLAIATNLLTVTSPAVAFQNITLTAQFALQASAAPATLTGIVSFTATGGPLGAVGLGAVPLNSSGLAVLNTAQLPAGTFQITATFNGSTTYPGATVAASAIAGPVSALVSPAPTTLALTGAPNPVAQGQLLTLTATIADAPSTILPAGPITYTVGSGSIFGAASLTPGGAATLQQHIALAPGTYSLVASYAGTADFGPSTSLPFTLTVTPVPPDFTVLFTPPALSVQASQPTPAPFVLTGLGSLADRIALSCENLPAAISCSFTAPSVPLSAGQVQSLAVQINATPVHNGPTSCSDVTHRNEPRPRGLPIAFVALLPITWMVSRRLRTRRIRQLALVLLLFTTLSAMTGCTTVLWFGTPPATYTVQLTARGMQSGVIHTTPLTVTVIPPDDRTVCTF